MLTRLTLPLLFLLFCSVWASPEDPHVPVCFPSSRNWHPFARLSDITERSVLSKGPCEWFEGWYTRIIDPVQNRSFVVIIGSLIDGQAQVTLVQGTEGSSPAVATSLTKDSSVTVAGQPVVCDPDPEAAPDLQWTSPKYGTFRVRANGTELQLHLPETGCTLQAVLTHQTPWRPGRLSAGPEGWASKVPSWLVYTLGITRWYIHSLSSKASYTFTNSTDGTTVTGKGWAHEEKNWGRGFPQKHVWAQAIAPDNSSQLVIGAAWFPFVAGVSTPPLIALGYRSADQQLDFRSNDPGTVFSNLLVDPCGGRFHVTAHTLKHVLQLRVEASRSTFSVPLPSPGKGGWKPGCEESLSAVATVTVSAGWPFRRGEGVVHTAVIKQAALEFGEGWLCDRSGQDKGEQRSHATA